ncbi:MAG: adenylosuccinate synthase [Firmicutes bacterium]|nr:adenylosuccinate synthase [Bacillota bacterium]
MKNTVIVGAQWGDEGKGKITDYLAENADIVARYGGGSNAGHTVVIGNNTFKLHLIPSGILHSGKICILGGGMVIDLELLLQEMDNLEKKGVSTGNLRISSNAHLILPYHRVIDKIQEERRGSAKIGTTGQGIGPAYVDKVARSGIRVIDVFDEEVFDKKLRFNFEDKNLLIKDSGLILEKIKSSVIKYAERIKPLVCDTSLLIKEAMDKGAKVIMEGAQGTLLDLDFGTYPFVTSSNSTAGGACTGLGIPPQKIEEVMGITKAYTTRVGTGPFPTELSDSTGEKIRQVGAEYGTTTGRQRRCGWLDLVIIKYSVRINGITGFALMKLDVLTGIEKLNLCTSYEYNGSQINYHAARIGFCHSERSEESQPEILRDAQDDCGAFDRKIKEFPQSLRILEECTPRYEEMDGWQENISEVKSFSLLLPAARKYITAIEDFTKVPVKIISVGPERNQTIVR